MPTPLDKPLKREVEIDGEPYTLTIDPTGLKLTRKGRRRGVELTWQDLASGEAAALPEERMSARARRLS